jgi:hypothetical protein
MSFLSLVLLISIVPISSLASTNAPDDETMNVSLEELENTAILVDSINELDQKLDMENLSSNSQEEINQLSVEAKELYNLIVSYEKQKSTSLTGEDVLPLFNEYVEKLNKNEISRSNEYSIAPAAVINYKEYKISNADIQKLVKLAGLNGGFWATATAIAKIWAKSPTVLTLMIAAVPALGVAGLNLCNSKNKGVIITKIGSGATNSYSCRSQ